MLTISNLSKTYHGGPVEVHALKDINLSIDKGMFGLLGPNGAGKSTLMRTIATLQEPDSGSITLQLEPDKTVDVLKEKQMLRKNLGYLPQDFGVYPRISAEKLLDHFALLKGLGHSKERKEVVDYFLQQTNLYQARKKSVDSFSGGMRQRFGIAQALLGDPRLLIVDEPTAGLDPSERNRFHNLLAEIGESIVVILSTHIVEDVTDLCTKMAVLGSGDILLTGRPDSVIDELKGKIWSKRIPRKALDAVTGEFNVISSKLVAGELMIHVYHDVAPDSSFQSIEPNLEDVYFKTLGDKNIALNQPAQ